MSRVKNAVLRRIWTGRFSAKACTHLDMVRDVQPRSEVCDPCVASGDTWPALRMCLICGHVGCCDKAKNQHALQHIRATGHPIARPYRERGMDWLWCYEDRALLDP